MIEYVCDKPVPGVQIVESDAKWGWRRKKCRRGRGEKGENSRLLSPPASLRRHHYLNACKTTTTTLKILIVVVPVDVLRLFELLSCVTVPRNLSCYTLKTLGHVHWLIRMILVQAQRAIRPYHEQQRHRSGKSRSHTSNIVLRRSEYQFILVWHKTYPICDAPTSRSAWHSFAPLQKSRRRNHRCCVLTEVLSGIVSRLSRVGWFSRALAFRLLYYPWGKMGTTCSLSVKIALAHISAQFWLCQKINIL